MEGREQLNEAKKGWINLNKYKLWVCLFKSWKVVEGSEWRILTATFYVMSFTGIRAAEILHSTNFKSTSPFWVFCSSSGEIKSQSVLIAITSSYEFSNMRLANENLRSVFKVNICCTIIIDRERNFLTLNTCKHAHTRVWLKIPTMTIAGFT